MNKGRREAIHKLRVKLEAIRVDIINLKDEEEIAPGNLAENMQAGQKGDRMKAAIRSLDAAAVFADAADAELYEASK